MFVFPNLPLELSVLIHEFVQGQLIADIRRILVVSIHLFDRIFTISFLLAVQSQALEALYSNFRNESGMKVWKSITNKSSPISIDFIKTQGGIKAVLKPVWNGFCEAFLLPWKWVNESVYEIFKRIGMEDYEAKGEAAKFD
jgi:hypothetical protein